jgi:uncharacterized protein DUF3592
MTASSPSFISLARRSFWLLFGGIWLIAGILMLVFGVVFALREQQFSADGALATGIVLEKRIIPADSDSSTEHRVVYRFTTTDGTVVEGNDAVDVNFWDGLVERGPIEISYLPAQPETNRIGSGSDVLLPVIFLIAGVVLVGIGGVLVIRSMRAIAKARRLLRVGVPVDATVTSVEATNVSYRRRQQFRVRFTYADGQGATHEGDSGYLDFEEANLWTPGDVVRVRFDPEKPDESHWLGAADPATEKPRIVDARPAVDAPPPVDAAPPVDAKPPTG